MAPRGLCNEIVCDDTDNFSFGFVDLELKTRIRCEIKPFLIDCGAPRRAIVSRWRAFLCRLRAAVSRLRAIGRRLGDPGGLRFSTGFIRMDRLQKFEQIDAGLPLGFKVGLGVEHIAEGADGPRGKQGGVDADLEAELGEFEVDGLIKVGLGEPSVEHSRLDMQIVHCGFDGSSEGENPVEEVFLFWGQPEAFFVI